MNFEMTRVYRDIIEEVMRGLKAEQDEMKISIKQLNELKTLWGQKLREMTTPTEMPSYNFRSISTNETINKSAGSTGSAGSVSADSAGSVSAGSAGSISSANSVGSICSETTHSAKTNEKNDDDDKSVDHKSFDDFSSELTESNNDEKLEAQHPNYMMCLYDKVDKSKDRWRVKMKQGFLNIGKSEFAFDTAHGSLYW
ncbi:transcription factor IIA subunit alpha [Binucleata daphniae]